MDSHSMEPNGRAASSAEIKILRLSTTSREEINSARLFEDMASEHVERFV